MHERQTRRDFFRGAASMTAAAMGGLGAGLHSRPTEAIEPIARNGTPKFKFSLAGYSYRNLLQGDPPELTLDDFFTDCARFGLEGTEPTSYYFPEEVTTEYLCHLKQLAFRLGLDISGTAIRNDFCHPPGAERDENIAHVKKWIEHAEILGAPVIRIFSGKPRGDQTVEEAERLAVAGMEECCDHAGRHGVFLALENHGGLTAEADGMLRMVEAVRSPWFGVNFDSGNFRSEDPYADLAKIAPYALNVQIKVAIQTPDRKKKVPSDFDRLAKILRHAGYRGYIVLEYEESEDPRVACPRYIDELREVFG